MYLSGNLPMSNSSGEQRSSYQSYSMSQVNNEKPVVHREHEEHNQSWGQPITSSSTSIYPTNFDQDKKFTSVNRLASSSSSICDHQNGTARDNTRYRYQDGGISSTARREQQSSTSSSYTKISNTNKQSQSGAQHFHEVPLYHGFRFQSLPGFSSKMIDIEKE